MKILNENGKPELAISAVAEAIMAAPYKASEGRNLNEASGTLTVWMMVKVNNMQSRKVVLLRSHGPRRLAESAVANLVSINGFDRRTISADWTYRELI